jgi:hypothetical protein
VNVADWYLLVYARYCHIARRWTSAHLIVLLLSSTSCGDNPGAPPTAYMIDWGCSVWLAGSTWLPLSKAVPFFLLWARVTRYCCALVHLCMVLVSREPGRGSGFSHPHGCKQVSGKLHCCLRGSSPHVHHMPATATAIRLNDSTLELPLLSISRVLQGYFKGTQSGYRMHLAASLYLIHWR